MNGLTVGNLKTLQRNIAEARQKAEKLEMADKKIYGKIDFYKSVAISCQAVIDYSNRFADLAEAEAQKYEDGSKRRGELLEIARICRKVPANSPDTYQEAVQESAPSTRHFVRA